ncbi:hypothetical protein SDC9_53203 [bioreactor metagenome]|uniref:Lipoprotein n=1 Tax=bioreactor metagenome TaxID=1076179 RepID=A0A644WSR3_9ZZZZ|nr:hypothetical protein [Oscillospiraceae bacterium]
MKTKTFVKITSIITLSLLLFSCTPQTPYLTEEESKTGSQNTSGKFKYFDNGDSSTGVVQLSMSPWAIADKNYVYTQWVNQNDGKLMRYDIKTRTMKNACADPVCTHDSEKCPLYYMQSPISFAHDGIIGISMRDPTVNYSFRRIFYTYDTNTNSLRQIYTTELATVFYESDEYYFVLDMLLKEGGDEKNYDSDYERF